MPKLIVPSNGGGTKLMRTLRAGELEGVSSGAGGGVVDSFGEIDSLAANTDLAAAITTLTAK